MAKNHGKSKHGDGPHDEGPDAGSVSSGGPVGSDPLAARTTDAPDDRADGGGAVVMLIRHGEKPDGGKPYGVTADGERDEHSLTVAGWARAGALAALFGSDRPVPGLRRPDAVYAAFGGDSGGLRPLQTVVPLAARLGTDVITRYAKGDEKRLATELAAGAGAAVVSWTHETIPAIVAHLGPVTPAPPARWPDDRYDVVWVFQRDRDGWTFTQVPQLLLAGDRPEPIAG